MEAADVKALAVAFAKANGHPMPEAYGDRVAAAFVGEPIPDYPEPTPPAPEA